MSVVEVASADRIADVCTSYGICRGQLAKSGVRLWRGIPYASVPQRFSRAVKPLAWEGIRNCFKKGKQAVQPTPQMLIQAHTQGTAIGTLVNAVTASSTVNKIRASMSEQCLSLSIRAPAPTGELHPTMVWIHGGAFLVGSGSDAIYQSNYLVKHGNVVLVTINYRLGSFGYLNLPGFDTNCGLGDQCMALQWIHEEIHNFGGDPNRITIFGESAGGMSCGALVASPRAQPFFQRAILMSGALSNVMSASDASAVAERFCETARMSPNQLRTLSTEDMSELQNRFLRTQKMGAMPFQPCVDGDLLVAHPLEAVSRGMVQISGKQIMLGSNESEWELFSPSMVPEWLRLNKSTLSDVSTRASKGIQSQGLDELTHEDASKDQVRALLKSIRKDQQLESWDQTLKAYRTLLIFTAPARLAARVLSEKADTVWVYHFSFKSGLLGACHAAELPLLFGTYDKHWILERFSGSKADPRATQEVSKTMALSFTAFARTGSPDAGARSWSQPYTASNPFVYVLDGTPSLVLENHQPDSALNLGIEFLQSAYRDRPWGVNIRPLAKHSKL